MLAAEAISSQDRAKNTRFGYINKRFSTQHGVEKALSLWVVFKIAPCCFAKLPILVLAAFYVLPCSHFCAITHVRWHCPQALIGIDRENNAPISNGMQHTA